MCDKVACMIMLCGSAVSDRVDKVAYVKNVGCDGERTAKGRKGEKTTHK